LPVLAPDGTVVTTFVVLQLVGVAASPLKVTVLLPCVVPKFVPVMVIETPGDPDVGDRLVMLGVGTVKCTPLLTNPPTVITTLPVPAPFGTAVVMLVALQADAVAGTPLNVTVLLACVAPKLLPVSVTAVPAWPDVGLTLLMFGGAWFTVSVTVWVAVV